MPERLYIRKQKRPKGSGFWGVYLTARDNFGLWLFTPRGSLYRGEDGRHISYCNVGSPRGPGIPVMHLMPPTGWWVATFWAPGEADWSLTFDVSTPPRLLGRTWTYVDLELDLQVDRRTGELSLQDEDEFTEAVAQGFISPGEAAAARSAVDEISALVERPPRELTATGEARLLQALDLHLPPITDLG